VADRVGLRTALAGAALCYGACAAILIARECAAEEQCEIDRAAAANDAA